MPAAWYQRERYFAIVSMSVKRPTAATISRIPRSAGLAIAVSRASPFRTHVREQDHVPDRRAVGEQHHEAIDPEPGTRGRRQPVLHCADVVRVVVHRFLLAGFLEPRLLAEPLGLVLRVVQLGEAVRDLLRVDEKIEPI